MTERGCELLRRQSKMHEVAEASSVTFPVFVLSATCLTEIRDWREFCVQRSTRIPPVVQILDGSLGFRFPFETGINISDKMITNVITDLFRVGLAIIRVWVQFEGSRTWSSRRCPNFANSQYKSS